MKSIAYREVQAFTNGWWTLFVALGLIALTGLGAAYYMEHSGHWVTGMNNQVVWGMPHVFAVFLIVAASGALNVASVSSVFGRTAYKPMAPLSALTALSLLAGGLMALVLDLGRPDRLIVAMTHYNFRSIFAWNVILYNGFFVIVGIYIWMMMDRRMKAFQKPAGLAAFLWRLVLTTGTGSIFGFLVARSPYDSAILAPLFIAASLAFGTAVFLLVVFAAAAWGERPLGDALVRRLKNMLGLFIAVMLYFVAVQHLTNLYIAEKRDAALFVLANGGVYTTVFWGLQVLLGGLVPLGMVFHPCLAKNRTALGTAAVLTILGGLGMMFVVIIGGQAYPLQLFPGYEVSSSFFDGRVNDYTPTLPEFLLGLGGMAVAAILITVGSTALRFIPASMADEVIDPHCAAKAAKK